jgi:hypothetical protein
MIIGSFNGFGSPPRRMRRYRLWGMQRGGLQSADPAFVMSTGIVQPWTTRDPRAQLTNVSSMTQHQAHPDLAGFSAWSWLKGDY